MLLLLVWRGTGIKTKHSTESIPLALQCGRCCHRRAQTPCVQLSRLVDPRQAMTCLKVLTSQSQQLIDAAVSPATSSTLHELQLGLCSITIMIAINCSIVASILVDQ